MLKKQRIIIFDFDGTILENLEIKDRTIIKFFSDTFGDSCIGEVNRFKLAHLNRYQMLDTLISKYTMKNSESKQELLDKLSTVMLNEQKKAYLVKGLIEYLDHLLQSSYFYISSNAPKNEVEELCKAFFINEYFTKISGHPESKREFIKRVIEENTSINEIYFIGDSIYDYEIANELGIKFITRLSIETEKELNLVKDLVVINDYLELTF